MAAFPFSLARLIARTHTMVALTMLVVVVAVMAGQVAHRSTFASTELYDDVMDRWGTPIVQGAPSVRFVEHGAVFHELEALPLAEQRVTVDAEMNYRKRGLVYFSGFEFDFAGHYSFENPHAYPIDVAFVFPLSVQRAQVLLSDLTFSIDGEPAPIALQDSNDKLLWTGRVEPGQSVVVDIGYRGRGLDSFRYALDPSLPVRGLDLSMTVSGGDTFDYAPGVVPATTVQTEGDAVQLRWQYDALEAGVPMGAILPAETGYDEIITTMVLRSWVPFLMFFAGLVVLGIWRQHTLRVYETGLMLGGWLFFFVMLPYLAAFVHFGVAYVLSLALCGGLLLLYTVRLMGRPAMRPMMALLGATLFTPTFAVLLTGYTGLVYTIEIFAALALLMVATTRPGFQEVLAGLRRLSAPADGGA